MYRRKNIFRFVFHFIKYDVQNKHRFYESYINDINERLLNDRQDLENAYKKAMDEAESEEHKDSIDSHFQDLWEENYEFNPSLLYGSVFLSLYGYLEGTLKHCYEECVISHGFSYPPIEKKKKAVDDYKGFFNKYQLFKFSPYKGQFKFLDDCAQIRDKLIHTSGEMTDEEIDTIKPILTKYDSISININRFGIVKKDIVLQLNNTIREILEPLCNHLYNTIEEYKG